MGRAEMLHSMTGFAAETGHADGLSWSVEMRGVNAKGLDIRVRVPERMLGFDQTLKAHIQKLLHRGNINVTLRVEQEEGASGLRLDHAALAAVLQASKEVQEAAAKAGLELAPPSSAEILAARGVLTQSDGALMPAADAVMATANSAIEAFLKMRAREGAALREVLLKALKDVSALVAQAKTQAEARKGDVARSLKENLATVLDNSDGADPDRVAQELALLAVKADVQEEIDRLEAHVAAAREMIETGGAMGRKLDFLMQEFNREANTLCSKSGSTALTRTGLDLKAVIDQMREQVQNVE